MKASRRILRVFGVGSAREDGILAFAVLPFKARKAFRDSNRSYLHTDRGRRLD
jgi:hypothetical protein